jgi:fused signal recognition particle receptor
VFPHCLTDDLRNGKTGRQAGIGILENDLHIGTVFPQLGLREAENIHAVKEHFTLGLILQTQDGLADGGLAAAGLTNQTHGRTALDLKGDAVNSLYMANGLLKEAGLDGEVFFQILNDQQVLLVLFSAVEAIDANVFDFSKKPYVIMVVGVNGVGKTTTIGKLAARIKASGKKVMLGAADTFRAAAVDQLVIWSERAGVPIVKQAMGSDPASVAYDTVKSAVANDMDVVLIDTAGRLHNKVNLMNELTKIRNVMRKVVPDAPHEVLLVLDGSTGQNAFVQAKEFTKATDITAMAVTKLDGTAKGGVVLGIADQFNIPVKFIGVGEKIEDLQIFDKKSFVDSLFS